MRPWPQEIFRHTLDYGLLMVGLRSPDAMMLQHPKHEPVAVVAERVRDVRVRYSSVGNQRPSLAPPPLLPVHSAEKMGAVQEMGGGAGRWVVAEERVQLGTRQIRDPVCLYWDQERIGSPVHSR